MAVAAAPVSSAPRRSIWKGLPVGRRTWRDFVVGWRDGRRGIPLLLVAGEGVAVAPSGHLHSMWAQLAQDLATEHRWLLAQTREDRMEFAVYEPKIGYLFQSLRESEDELSATIAQGPATGRRLGERALPEDQVQRRRRLEHEQRVREVREEIAKQRNELSALGSRKLALESSIEAALRESVARGQRSIGATNHRIAAYLKGAARTHSSTADLAQAAVTAGPELPSWMQLTTARDLMAATEKKQ